MFIGRETELKFLNDKYSENGGQLIVLYGRRRVGKILFSYLLASSAFLQKAILLNLPIGKEHSVRYGSYHTVTGKSCW